MALMGNCILKLGASADTGGAAWEASKHPAKRAVQGLTLHCYWIKHRGTLYMQAPACSQTYALRCQMTNPSLWPHFPLVPAPNKCSPPGADHPDFLLYLSLSAQNTA